MNSACETADPGTPPVRACDARRRGDDFRDSDPAGANSHPATHRLGPLAAAALQFTGRGGGGAGAARGAAGGARAAPARPAAAGIGTLLGLDTET
ncbi:hypothetical protein, partial [Nocardia abscessus]|uniref:hypothetical protein n=1 Tax=Nocardia abscessus TaxID=120957 RepID=UPI0024585E91